MNNKLIPMNLAFFVPPQGDSDKQCICLTSINIYVYELLKKFANDIQNLKTEIIPVIAKTENHKLDAYNRKKAEKTGVIAIPEVIYEYSYNVLIKFNANVDKFQAIHNWYFEQIDNVTIHWDNDAAEPCLRDWEGTLTADKEREIIEQKVGESYVR